MEQTIKCIEKVLAPMWSEGAVPISVKQKKSDADFP